MTEGWYAVKSRPQGEKTALQDLKTRFGIEGFLPMLRERRARRGALEWHEAPLFPTYLFVNEDLGRDEVWRRVLSGIGVVRVLGGERPAPAERAAMEKLIQRCKEGGGLIDLDDEEDAAVEFLKGDEVKVTSGAFTGFTGNVNNYDRKRKKVELFLRLLGRPLVLFVDHEQVIPIALADEARQLTMCRSAAAFARYDKAARGRR